MDLLIFWLFYQFHLYKLFLVLLFLYQSQLLELASIKYFNDAIKSKKIYKKPNEDEKNALDALVNSLDNCDDAMKPEDIQTTIYTVGKENGYKENLRDWFKLIYEVVFGVENGPRFGFFISFFGVQETKELIKSKLENV